MNPIRFESFKPPSAWDAYNNLARRADSRHLNRFAALFINLDAARFAAEFVVFVNLGIDSH